MRHQPLSKNFKSLLGEIFPTSHLYTDAADCWNYGYDNSQIHVLPSAVAFPTTHDEFEKLVQLCNEFHVSLTARGRGTGTTGAAVPTNNSIVVSLERMNKIIEFSPNNRYIEVEPGITNQAVQDIVGKSGFFWPPDPTSAAFCTIGGNLAYNSAGPRAVKYGTPRENTLGLSAVTGSGKSIRTGVYTTKGVVGYDLTRLLIGSEGTLAIITSAILKLCPSPEAKITLRAIYSNIDGAAEAIANIMANPIVPCALEFLDGNAVNIVRNHSDIKLPETAKALLMIEVDGTEGSLADAREKISAAATNSTLIEIASAGSAAESVTLWNARKALSPALRQIAPTKINEDVVVPITEIPSLISGLDKLSTEFKIPIVNFGHAGNGNVHVNILYDDTDPEEQIRAESCLAKIFDLVLGLNGSLSGEHGIGLIKRNYIDKEINSTTVTLMKNIKEQFDPNGILNPGKMFPDNC